MKNFGFLFLWVFAGCATSNIQKASRELGKTQNDQTGRFKTKTFYQVRSQLLKAYPELFRGVIDTLFFIEKSKVISWVSDWDTLAVRKAEARYSTTERDVHASRIVSTGHKYLVNTLVMRDLLFER